MQPLTSKTPGPWSKSKARPRHFSMKLTNLPLTNLSQKHVDFRVTLPGGQAVTMKEIPLTDTWGAVRAKLWDLVGNLVDASPSTASSGGSGIFSTPPTPTSTPSITTAPTNNTSPEPVPLDSSGGVTTQQPPASPSSLSSSSSSSLQAMNRYFVKVAHTHVYLSGDTTPLYVPSTASFTPLIQIINL